MKEGRGFPSPAPSGLGKLGSAVRPILPAYSDLCRQQGVARTPLSQGGPLFGPSSERSLQPSLASQSPLTKQEPLSHTGHLAHGTGAVSSAGTAPARLPNFRQKSPCGELQAAPALGQEISLPESSLEPLPAQGRWQLELSAHVQFWSQTTSFSSYLCDLGQII